MAYYPDREWSLPLTAGDRLMTPAACESNRGGRSGQPAKPDSWHLLPGQSRPPPLGGEHSIAAHWEACLQENRALTVLCRAGCCTPGSASTAGLKCTVSLVQAES